MKNLNKFLAYMLTMAIVMTCVGISTFAAPSYDLSVEDFTLKFSQEENTLTVQLVCHKDVGTWGAGAGVMSVTNGTGSDASNYFTLDSITTQIGDPNDSEASSKWSSTANDFDAGDFIEAGTWTTYVYTVAEDIPAGDYTFTMQFSDGDCYDGVDLEDYSISGQSISSLVYRVLDPIPEIYAATLTPAATNANPVRVGQTLKVNVGANKSFASTEMTITYPADLVSFDKDNSTLGNATITDNGSGELKLADYGADKTAAADNYVLAFTANAKGDASFAVTKAGFGTGETAETADLEYVETLPEALSIAIDATQYTVTMTDIFTGASGVNKGETYVFYPESATGAYYSYVVVQVFMDGAPVTPNIADDGGWKIENVTGNLEISGTREPKQYGVYWSGNAYTDVANRPDHATYSQDFSFVMPANQEAGTEDGYRYELTVTMGGKTYTGYTINGQTYTIPGGEVTDGIYIKIDKITIAANQFEVEIGGTYASAVTADAYTVAAGGNVTLTLTPDAGYVYEIKVNGQKVEFVNNQYTINNVQANVTVEVVSKTLNLDIVESGKFLTVDGTNVYLVLAKIQKIDGYTYTYNDNYMYWSDKYEAYAIVVFGQPEITAETIALVKVDVIPTVVYDGDVNGTTNVDANDAQLVYNIYNAQYDAFNAAVTMEKFLKADMTGDKKIDSGDAAFIINQILGISNN